MCELRFLVDWDGNVCETTVHKSSGVLMYDISARMAVAKMDTPRWSRGKEFIVAFRQ